MATVLVTNNSNAQSKKFKELKKGSFFGEKSYNYKSFGLKNADENLKRAKSKYNLHRKSGKKRGYKDNNNRQFYQNADKFYGFSYRDFGRDEAFDPVLDRAARITDLMDNHLRLTKNQAYDVFRLHVLFVSDLMQLQQETGYATGVSYSSYGYEQEVRTLIFENYFDALEDILKRSQQRELDYYFSRYDYMGNRKYSSYNYNNYDRYDRYRNYGNNNDYDRPRNRDRYGSCD